MNSEQKKITGVVLCIISAICLFIAIERANTNANNVNAMNQLAGPLKQLTGGGEFKAATPTASIYAGLFAVICGIGGTVMLATSKTLQKS